VLLDYLRNEVVGGPCHRATVGRQWPTGHFPHGESITPGHAVRATSKIIKSGAAIGLTGLGFAVPERLQPEPQQRNDDPQRPRVRPTPC